MELPVSVKTTKRVNFTEMERVLFMEILKGYPVVRDKRKTANVENAKRDAWLNITIDYNANSQVTRRDESQLKNLLRTIKAGTKRANVNENVEEYVRTEFVQTPTASTSTIEGLKSVLESRQTYDDPPKNDDISSDDEEISCYRDERKRKMEATHEFYAKKIKFLKEEHRMRMRILQKELEFKELEFRMREREIGLTRRISQLQEENNSSTVKFLSEIRKSRREALIEPKSSMNQETLDTGIVVSPPSNVESTMPDVEDKQANLTEASIEDCPTRQIKTEANDDESCVSYLSSVEIKHEDLCT